MIFGHDFQPFARFQCLVQTVTKSPAFHGAASKLINNDNAFLLDHVMGITLEQMMRPQAHIHMMQ